MQLYLSILKEVGHHYLLNQNSEEELLWLRYKENPCEDTRHDYFYHVMGMVNRGEYSQGQVGPAKNLVCAKYSRSDFEVYEYQGKRYAFFPKHENGTIEYGHTLV